MRLRTEREMTMTDNNSQIITAHVPTANGSRYMQQLFKHWSHRFEVTVDASKGSVDFGGSSCAMEVQPDGLLITMHMAKDGDVERMKSVVSEHLDRFAFREAPLSYAWSA